MLPRADDRPRAERRLLALVVASVVGAHAGALGLIAWAERINPPVDMAAPTEIPVELATPAEARAAGAEGAPAESRAPAAQTRPEASQPAEPPVPRQAAAPSESAAPRAASREGAAPQGLIAERPRETDLPQAARTRGDEQKKDEHKKEERRREKTNPFGGLAALTPETPDERAPVFVSPQKFVDDRPRPAPDPTNDNYRAKVLGKVAASMIDPDRPRPKALTIVGFKVDDAGALVSAWLVRPSGHADLDAEALEMVKRAAPFPPPPASGDHDFAAAIAFGPQD